MLDDMATTPRALPTARELAVMQRIADAAHARSLSQSDLALAAGVSQSQVSRLLSGKRAATLTEVLALLAAVGLDLETVARDLGL